MTGLRRNLAAALLIVFAALAMIALVWIVTDLAPPGSMRGSIGPVLIVLGAVVICAVCWCIYDITLSPPKVDNYDTR